MTKSKILSIMLAFVMIISSFAVIGIASTDSASASAKKTIVKTGKISDLANYTTYRIGNSKSTKYQTVFKLTMKARSYNFVQLFDHKTTIYHKFYKNEKQKTISYTQSKNSKKRYFSIGWQKHSKSKVFWTKAYNVL